MFLTLTFSAFLAYSFGECDFSKLVMTGHYQVGFREFKTDFGNAVSVFYPMDRADYNNNIKHHNTPWLRDGSKTLMGIAVAG